MAHFTTTALLCSKCCLGKLDHVFFLQQKYADYTLYITQAIEYLHLASQIGLRNGFKEIIAKASYALVECIGTRDPVMSAQHLALFQVRISSWQ